MQTWTIDEMLLHRPCPDYPRERLVELWAGRERLGVIDILNLDIPAADRVWAALQAGDHVGPAVDRIVRRAVERASLTHDAPEYRRWAADAATVAATWAAWAAVRAATTVAEERNRQIEDIVTVVTELHPEHHRRYATATRDSRKGDG
jgi:hypothetical protein